MASEIYSDARISRTTFSHADADLLAKTLIEYADYPADNVLLRKLDEGTPLSPDDIIDQLEELVSLAESGDTVMFYNAGHGVLFEGRAYLFLSKTDLDEIAESALSLQAISGVLRREDIVNVRLFDACHSGQYVRTSGTLADPDGFLDALASEKAPRGWVTMAACSQHEMAYADPRLGHGVFTYYLCQAIRDSPPGKPVFPETLKTAVCDLVHQRAHLHGEKQTPTYHSSLVGNHAVAERRLAPKKTVEPAEILPLEEQEPRILNVDLTVAKDENTYWAVMTLDVASSSPPDFFGGSFSGPRGNIWGGGSSTQFKEVEGGRWQLVLKERISLHAPPGTYKYSRLYVRNEAMLESRPWPDVASFELPIP